MALEQRELFSSSTQTFRSNWEAKEMVVGVFGDAPASYAGDELTLAVGTPVSYNTSTTEWQVFDADGTNGSDTIRGFVFPDAVVLNANTGNDVLGQIMIAGRVDYDELVPAVDDAVGYNETQLKAELVANAAARGLYVKNLADVR